MKKKNFERFAILGMVTLFGLAAFLPVSAEKMNVKKSNVEVVFEAPANIAAAAGKTVVTKGCWVVSCKEVEMAN